MKDICLRNSLCDEKLTGKNHFSSDKSKINIFRVLGLTFNAYHGILKKVQKLKHHNISHGALSSSKIFVPKILIAMKTDN
jgi:hypothetical protein